MIICYDFNEYKKYRGLNNVRLYKMKSVLKKILFTNYVFINFGQSGKRAYNSKQQNVLILNHFIQ